MAHIDIEHEDFKGTILSDKEQNCYNSLIDEVEKRFFERTLKDLLFTYFRKSLDNFEKISVKIEWKDGSYLEQYVYPPTDWNEVIRKMDLLKEDATTSPIQNTEDKK